MYFDYIVLGLMVWGLTDALLNPNDPLDDESDESATDPAIDPDLTDGGDLLDGTDPETDPDPDDETEGDDFVDGTTTITVETDGEVSTSEFTDVDFGIAPTISGTEFRDTITATDTTGFAVNIDAGAGDDVVNFGYGANVDGGEGTDILTLSVTPNALASDNDVGTVDLTDADDALSVSLDTDTPDFVHTIRGQSSETVDGVEIRTVWIDYYVSDTQDLSTATLTASQTYGADDATRLFRAVIGEGPASAPVDVNTAPTIVLDRGVTSSVDLLT